MHVLNVLPALACKVKGPRPGPCSPSLWQGLILPPPFLRSSFLHPWPNGPRQHFSTKNSDWAVPRTLGPRQLFEGYSLGSEQGKSPTVAEGTLGSQRSQFIITSPSLLLLLLFYSCPYCKVALTTGHKGAAGSKTLPENNCWSLKQCRSQNPRKRMTQVSARREGPRAHSRSGE